MRLFKAFGILSSQCTFPSSLTRVELTLMRILPDLRSRGRVGG